MTRNFLIPMTAMAALAFAASAQAQQTTDQRGNMQQQQGMSQDRPSQQAQRLPIDRATDVGSTRVACTGVGDREEHMARWNNYPVKLVVSGDNHEYYAGEHVNVTGRDGQEIADMTCDGPWVMMKLDPGQYHATVRLPGHATKNVSFIAPSHGQHEVNVIFRENEADMGGQHHATEAGYQRPADTASPPQQPQ